jgi:saccharopine dehydrogenase-like NADP-dependent oxidoreductase
VSHKGGVRSEKEVFAVRVLVLGGGGAMGQITVRDLAESDDVSRVIVGDNNLEAALAFARSLGSPKVSIEPCDVTDHGSTVRLMKTSDVCVNATLYRFNLLVMRAAMEAGVSMLDLGGLYHMTRRQLAVHEEAMRAGILVVVGMGSDPGTSNICCRYLANKLDSVDQLSIRFGSTTVGQSFGFAISTILDEATKNAIVFRGGKIQEIPPLSEAEDVTFREPVGTCTTYPIVHSELATVPYTIKGVKEVSYKDSWDPAVMEKVKVIVDYGLTQSDPVVVNGCKVSPLDVVTAAIARHLKEEPVFGVDDLKVQARGTKDGRETVLSLDVVVHPYEPWGVSALAYEIGVPPSIVAQMIGRGEVEAKGALPPEECIDPVRFLSELSRRAVQIYETEQVTTVMGKGT